MRVRILLAGLAAACCCAVSTMAWAAGEHAGRLAAELAIMAGDARRLILAEGGPLERQGIEQRLHGALSSLPLLLRRARGDPAPVAALRATLLRRDWRGLMKQLDALKKRHPFDARRLLGAAPTAEALALGASIHKMTCTACHDAPPVDSLLPATNLVVQLKSMPREEFAARLWLGARGDKTTALANPFSDAELAAQIAWYSETR